MAHHARTSGRPSTRSVRTGSARPLRRGLLAGLGGTLSLAVLLSAALLAPSSKPEVSEGDTLTAAAARSSNPLKGHRWGVYKGNAELSWPPYVQTRGADRALLAKISERPKAKWFGAWIPNSEIGKKVDQYIENTTKGDPNVLVQMSVFRMVPWEHAACKRLPTPAEQASYRQWIDRAAAAIGRTHVALILQPDGPFALCAPNRSKVPSQLIAYSTRKFSALPNTNVYIDAGASDWPSEDPKGAADILVAAGIQHARGFATNSTHYATTGDEIHGGTRVVAELNNRGYRGKKFVINTSSNGQGFTFSKARGSHPDNANVCRTRAERSCVTLGIPPTTEVASTRWGNSPLNRAKAANHVDAYLWFGRPWLFMQADPFVKSRALQLARTTPW